MQWCLRARPCGQFGIYVGLHFGQNVACIYDPELLQFGEPPGVHAVAAVIIQP